MLGPRVEGGGTEPEIDVVADGVMLKTCCLVGLSAKHFSVRVLSWLVPPLAWPNLGRSKARCRGLLSMHSKTMNMRRETTTPSSFLSSSRLRRVV